MHKLTSVLALAMVLLPWPALASPVSDAASTCLTDSTTGKDRKDLIRWLFLSMARHPELATLASSTADEYERSNRAVGKLFTRLIAEDCAEPMSALVVESGPSAISQAFEVLGRVAMQELMAHPDVASSMGGLEEYVDHESVNKILLRPK